MPQPWTESSARLGLADQSQEDRLQQGVQPNHLQRIPLHTSPPPPKLQPIRVSTQGDGSGAGR